MLLQQLCFLLCVVAVCTFRSSVSLRKFHFTNRWVMSAYKIPTGGWSHTTFSLRERLPEDMKKAKEKDEDVSFWNNVQKMVDKVEAEGKKATDVVMLQIMEQCTAAHFSAHPEKIFDFTALKFTPEPPAGAAASATVTAAAPAVGEAKDAVVPAPTSPPSGDLSVEEASNLIIEAINTLGATSIKDMGKVMGDVRPKLTGKFDGSKIGELVKKILSAGPPFTAVTVPTAAAAVAVSGDSASAATTTSAAAGTAAPSGEASAEEATALILASINSVGATSMKDMGKVMSEVRPQLTGRFDMSKLSELVKKTLSAGPPFTAPTTTTAAAGSSSSSVAASDSNAASGTTTVAAAPATPAASLSDDELTAAVREAVVRLEATSGLRDMGKVMADLKAGMSARGVDSSRLSEVVKKVLSEQPPPAAAATTASGIAATGTASAPAGPEEAAVAATVVEAAPTPPPSTPAATGTAVSGSESNPPPVTATTTANTAITATTSSDASAATEEEVLSLVREAMTRLSASSLRDMGKVMADVRPQLTGRFDMSKLSELVKKTLSEATPTAGAADAATVGASIAATAAAAPANPAVAEAAPAASNVVVPANVGGTETSAAGTAASPLVCESSSGSVEATATPVETPAAPVISPADASASDIDSNSSSSSNSVVATEN